MKRRVWAILTITLIFILCVLPQVLAEDTFISVGDNVIIQDVELYLYGDVNHDGVINGKDLTLIRRHISGGFTLESFHEDGADVNVDRTINGKDLTLIRRHISGGFDVELGE